MRKNIRVVKTGNTKTASHQLAVNHTTEEK
jgi:hypothetical protein